MKVLLDTQIIVWIMVDDARLGRVARETLGSADAIYLSTASIWEISIKRAQGRLTVPDDLLDRVRASTIEPLAVTMEHGWLAGRLPMLHADPFDRMIIAQAISEGMTIVTSDRRMRGYGVPVIAA